jgi:hypothetical protein
MSAKRIPVAPHRGKPDKQGDQDHPSRLRPRDL